MDAKTTIPVSAKRWRIAHAEQEKAQELFRALRIHPALCQVLVQRGIETFDAAKAFFRPTIDQLHSPWLLKDMDKAVDRVLKAFNEEEKILVFGDYDVDGTTSVACMYHFLARHYNRLDFYIPHRYKEGYGVSKAGIDFAHENGFTLIIALDCGIKSVELIAYAKSLGIDFIVCDHHLPDERLPDAVAILNAKQPGCPYPFKELCGCGVGFKLICALCEKMQLPMEEAWWYLDLVATAIAADIVSMSGENRTLAFCGLEKANRDPNFGIRALSVLSNHQGPLQINNLVFMIAPRVNAAGRMDDARKAVQLFLSETLEEATRWAEQLHTDNSQRKEADSSITEEALALIGGDETLLNRLSTVLYQPHWHKGVVGIVASRLIEHYYRPTIVLTQSGDVVAGSARSVTGFNVYEAIHQCRDLLLGYGGHFYAAGMTMHPDNVEAFVERFEEVVKESIHPDLLIPEILIDIELNFRDITQSFYNILAQMEPFGPDNLRPSFISRRVMNTGYSRVVKEKHLRFSLRQDGVTFTGIGFGMADKMPLLEQNKPVDVVYKIDINEWNGEKSLQLRMVDVKLSDPSPLPPEGGA
ncbi:single-stranded-DNA-specific exonuclease RecJ [Flaviaesturariibacter aridisoli]|uniref:Single-stranded-DNA-specific exonuclease RecJ n=1 Tax=Flaviaesturariibacter aridisoli TaxID=2545761 RepID=A0A4R4E0U8_9BACT|nr:single-stranded-DNA-specific exonuclease RecJ [Flaviaesturariibacter aridisoli]TCZ73009.1 single-stranded-DNA-specific exonuclease RecJ [Flaviaesturariibacter aridisoli]